MLFYYLFSFLLSHKTNLILLRTPTLTSLSPRLLWHRTSKGLSVLLKLLSFCAHSATTNIASSGIAVHLRQFQPVTAFSPLLTNKVVEGMCPSQLAGHHVRARDTWELGAWSLNEKKCLLLMHKSEVQTAVCAAVSPFTRRITAFSFRGCTHTHAHACCLTRNSISCNFTLQYFRMYVDVDAYFSFQSHK